MCNLYEQLFIVDNIIKRAQIHLRNKRENKKKKYRKKSNNSSIVIQRLCTQRIKTFCFSVLCCVNKFV